MRRWGTELKSKHAKGSAFLEKGIYYVVIKSITDLRRECIGARGDNAIVLTFEAMLRNQKTATFEIGQQIQRESSLCRHNNSESCARYNYGSTV